MAEASIVLPVLILLVVSLIYLMVFFYESLCIQTELHGEIIEEVSSSEKPFEICRKEKSLDMKEGGLAEAVTNRKREARGYTVRGCWIVRAGEMFSEIKKNEK